MSNRAQLFRDEAKRLAESVAEVTAAAPNEANLRHHLELHLERACRTLGVTWVSYTLDRALRSEKDRSTKFADVSHGAVVIEYEPPASFGGREGAKVAHACEQAEEYHELLCAEEGRAAEDYILIAWDGASIRFGGFGRTGYSWERLVPFDQAQAHRLLRALESDGRPLVHPHLLTSIVGPRSTLGEQLIPRLFTFASKAQEAGDTRAALLFTEWKRLFGQVVGIQSDRLKKLIEQQSRAHNVPYNDDPAAYIFVLNTYIALVAKIVAALALPHASQNMMDSAVPLRDRFNALESGHLFASAGVTNLLVGDFFSWYLEDGCWAKVRAGLTTLLLALSEIDFDISRKSRASTRDLFKGLYESFIPREMRHALGEYYTPDWLAAHALDRLRWRPEQSLLDPTCGSGTFLLEALKRRLEQRNGKRHTASSLVNGLYGTDLNPLAVLAAKASLVVFLSQYLRADRPVEIPVFLADAINTPVDEQGVLIHTIQTELGKASFRLPRTLLARGVGTQLLRDLRTLLPECSTVEQLWSKILSMSVLASASISELAVLRQTAESLWWLHERKWDGIWCVILAERFAAASIPKVDCIVGNPPWVKWSHLPPEYAEFIKPQCQALGVFSDDAWVGGIEADISTVITYEAIRKWLRPNGKLAFFITGTVFSNESSQGFRRFSLPQYGLDCRVMRVEDFKPIRPFDGVSNHPTLLSIQLGQRTRYPVKYITWESVDSPRRRQNVHPDGRTFRAAANFQRRWAEPVPGTDSGPWLIGSRGDHEAWVHLFGGEQHHYVARKGVTTDLNGVYFVRTLEVTPDGLTRIQNAPALGRIDGLPQITAFVESRHLYPLLRGRGVEPCASNVDPEFSILLPQTGMHGDDNLHNIAPGCHAFLSRFKPFLERRGSYRRFQKGKAYWSVWSTGTYTFAPFKVTWMEMPGRLFAAGLVEPMQDAVGRASIVVPDHKVYFVPLDNREEAGYLAGFLNAPFVARAVTSYSAALSLGTSVTEYLRIPKYDPESAQMREISALAWSIHNSQGLPTSAQLARLDELVGALLA